MKIRGLAEPGVKQQWSGPGAHLLKYHVMCSSPNHNTVIY